MAAAWRCSRCAPAARKRRTTSRGRACVMLVVTTALVVQTGWPRRLLATDPTPEPPRQGSLGAPGGAAAADFEALMDLIESTIAPQSWDSVGGTGAMKPLPGGVYVDAEGVLRRVAAAATARESLEVIRVANQDPEGRATDVRRQSALRKISLPRLERRFQLRRAAGQLPDDEMLRLAGLRRIQYVLIYPDSGDLVLAGPAGAWTIGDDGRAIDATSGRPVMRLADLLVIWRHIRDSGAEPFGCAITPRREALAAARRFVEQSAGTPLAVGKRPSWLDDLRRTLGRQDIEVFGIDPRTHVARILVEADYRMKLVGLGIEPCTLGMSSYLDLAAARESDAAPLDVLRWWFTLDESPLVACEDRNAFELRGSTVCVRAENELLASDGRRVHTSRADPTNQEFAHNFTHHFEALAEKYPIYAELQQCFQLALVAALVQREHLAERVGWPMTYFADAKQIPVPLGAAPRSVETVMNHRTVDRKHFVAAVSGGVRVDPRVLFNGARVLAVDATGDIERQWQYAQPNGRDDDTWWWD